MNLLTFIIILTCALFGVAVAWMTCTDGAPGRSATTGMLARLGVFMAGVRNQVQSSLERVLAFPGWMARRIKYRGVRTACFANIAEGTHGSGNITKTSDAIIAERFRLAKIGAAATSIDVCGAADIPIGIITDEARAIGDQVNVALLGAVKGTQKMVASAAIAQGALLEPAANGRVVTLAGGAGTHHVVGKALDAAAAAGDVIEVIPYYFLRVI